MSRDSSVSEVTSYGLDDQRLIPDNGNDFIMSLLPDRVSDTLSLQSNGSWED